MQFQFLAVSGRAAGDASIRDQPPVKSCASLRLTPKRNPVVSSLSLSTRLSLSLCTLSPVSWSSSALFPPLFPSAVNRSPNSPASLFSGEHRLTPLPPPLPSFHRVNASNAWRPEFRVLKSWTGPVSSQFDELVARREEGGGFDEDFLRIGKLEYSWDVFARYDFLRER